MSAHVAFEFLFTADLHTEEGRKIAAAARTTLRPTEIDNLWKDTIGRGHVGTLDTYISRSGDPHEWIVAASTHDDYDRAAAAALREEVLAALRENAQDFKELRSDLNDGG